MSKKKMFRLKNSILAILLSAGMVLGLTPAYSWADGNITDVSGQIVADVSGQPEEQNAAAFHDVFIESGYVNWASSEGSEGGYGTLSYVSGTKLRARCLLDNYTYSAGDKITIYYESNFDCSGISVLLCNKNDSGYNITLGKLVNKENHITFTLPETEVFSDEIIPKYLRFQGTVGEEGSVLTFKGISFGEPVAEEGTTEEQGEEQGEETPEAVTPVARVAESSGYTLTQNEDGSVTVTYTTNTWNTLKVYIDNCDYTKYSQVVIDFAPYQGMNLGIRDASEKIKYKDHWANDTFESDERQTLSFSLQGDTEYLRFYCDPPLKDETQGEEKSFTIYGIKVVDPYAKEELMGVASFTKFTADEDTCTVEGGKDGIGSVTYTANTRVKCRAYFDGYTYKAGDVLVIDFDSFDNLDAFEQIIMGYGTSDKQYVTLGKPVIEDGTAVFTLPDDKGYFAEKQPTFIRFKGIFSATNTVTNFTGFRIYDGEEYAEYIKGDGPQYNADECPQGVSVTYYDGIYSRGFAWSTNDAVTENHLEYIKAEEGQEKETVDWSNATVVAASMKESTDVEDVTWHLFKAHVENLEENSKYFFRAGDENTGYSSVGSFTVEGSSDSIDKLTFVHLTDCQEDSQSGYVKWSKVLDAAYKNAPDSKFVAFTGDLTNDSHQSLSMKQWIWGLEEPKKVLLDSVIMPVAGNHDNYDYSFTDRFDVNWGDFDNGGVSDQRTGGCYSFTYGDDIAFIALNTNDADGGEDTFGTQYDWLKEQLEKYKDCKWKIVEVHKGMMSTGDHTNDGEVDWLRDILPPLFSKYGVDLVLQGHDHVYTRSRTYYYGEDFDGNLYNGQTPCWLDGEIINNYEIGGTERMVNLEPSGTHYVTINFCASKTYPVTKELDEVIYTGKNPFDENGCSVQPNLPMYGVVSIDGDTLTYDAYTYNSSTKESALYDTFTVDKNNERGYRDRNEGKEEVEFIEGITVESKKYDGKPVSINLKGFVCSVPEIIDYSTLEFEVVGRDGTDYYSKTLLPKEVGSYTLNVSISTKNRYYYGVSSIDFDISR